MAEGYFNVNKVILSMRINWEEIPTVAITAKGNENKIYLDHLPKGGKFLLPDKINWKESVGLTFYTLYEGEEYEISIDDYESSGGKLTLNVVGHHKADFKMNVSAVRGCRFRKLIHNIYGNPDNANRDLIIQAVGEEKTKTLSPYSDLEVELTCPLCGEKKKTHLINLRTNKRFKCSICSDGYSYPEKLTKKLLDSLEIEYITQFSYENDRRRYDFYLPKFNAILEIHGRQHYIETHRSDSRTLEKEQANDKLKREIALVNGVKEEDYHEIDCRESTLDYCRTNLIKALARYLKVELTDGEWLEVEKASQSSTYLEVINLYNKIGGTANSIAKKTGLNHPTVHSYLRRGDKIGLCKYNGEEAKNKAQSIPLVCINIETGEVKEFDSYKHVKQELGIKSDNIRKCVRGQQKSCKGYKWYLKEDFELLAK